MPGSNSNTRAEFREIPRAPGYRINERGIVESSLATKGNSWRLLSIVAIPKGAGRRIYRGVSLRYDGKKKVVGLHRLVLETFVGPCPPGMEACHNDGNPANNHLDNLRWDTRKNNHADKRLHGTHIEGSQIHGAKLNEVIVEEIIVMLIEGRSGREIRQRIEVSPKTLNKIARKTHWKHVIPDRPVMSVPYGSGYRIDRPPKDHGSRLDISKVEAILDMLAAGHTGEEIRRTLQVDGDSVSAIARKKRWKHIRPGRPVMIVPRSRRH